MSKETILNHILIYFSGNDILRQKVVAVYDEFVCLPNMLNG